MICPWVEITSFMGAVLNKVLLTRGVEYPLPFVYNDKHRSKTYFYALLMILKTYKTKKLEHMLVTLLPSAKGLYFTLC